MENEPYVGLSQVELFEQLQQVEAELCGIHARRAELTKEEDAVQERRTEIQRALGCFVLEDKRGQTS